MSGSAVIWNRSSAIANPALANGRLVTMARLGEASPVALRCFIDAQNMVVGDHAALRGRR